MDKKSMIQKYEACIYDWNREISILEEAIHTIKMKIQEQEDIYDDLRKSVKEVEKSVERKKIINETLPVKFPNVGFVKIASSMINEFENRNNCELIESFNEAINAMKNEILRNYEKLDEYENQIRIFRNDILQAEKDIEILRSNLND